MTRRLSVAHLTAIDLAPPALIEVAAEAGFDAVGLRLLRVTEDSPGYPLMDDPAALRETLRALRNTGIAVADIEFIRITPEIDVARLRPMLDAGAALGAKCVIAAPYDDDLDRLADSLGRLSEDAAERGLTAVLEFFPWTPVPDLAACRRVVEAAGPRTGLLVDALHFDRSRSSHEDLAAIPAFRLPFAHICDAPVLPAYTTEQLLRTARAERLAPGDGEIDLARFLAALPADIPLGVETPMPATPGARDPVASLRRIRQATEAVVAAAPKGR